MGSIGRALVEMSALPSALLVGFLVVWESVTSSGDDTNRSIEARLVVGPNQFGGPQTQVNIWDNDSGQSSPGAHGWYGRAVINWRTISLGIEPIPPSNNDDHIVGRDLEDGIFCDDLEWFSPGSTDTLWRWAFVLGAASP